jgi:hypothetical protein
MTIQQELLELQSLDVLTEDQELRLMDLEWELDDDEVYNEDISDDDLF